jgi:D-beta-D-heptose 7-phosphate kinase/D-beta-D-heptose 1-phosphate adenosyltransferase
MIDFTAHIHSKILIMEHLPKVLQQWRFRGQKIVFTNGCFDILHRGHIEYLAKAATLGDRLLVGLNADKSVKILKGELRPVNDEASRALLLAALEFVSGVVIFEEETPYNLIKFVKPEILVKGGDYAAENVVGKEFAGKVVIVPLSEGFSTSSIISKLENGS